MQFYSLAIHQVTRVTPQAVEIVFDLPDELKETFTYTAGQYLTLKATIDQQEVRRAYSLSSAPHESQWRVVVKVVEKGLFSNYAMSLKAGDVLDVAPPMGNFTHHRATQKDYLLLAAGSGITPIISILKDILTNEPHSQVALLYGNQSPAYSIYYEQLNDLKDHYSDRLLLTYAFSREDRDDCLSGRINPKNLAHFIQEQARDFTFYKAYLCGPEDMIHSSSNLLVEKNILHKEHIHYELFTSNDNTPSVEKNQEGQLAEVTVILDDESHSFTMNSNEILLDVMLKNDIDAPYSCQGGICSSCICLVEQGSVNMTKNSILSEDEIADGLSLACTGQPTSDKVVINFDEV